MHEPLSGEVGRGAHGQRACVLPLQQALGATSDAIERIAHDGQVSASSFRDDEPLAFPVEQLEAELRFQRFHQMAHRALRDAQLFGRAREALVTRGSLEGLQSIQCGQTPWHGATS